MVHRRAILSTAAEGGEIPARFSPPKHLAKATDMRKQRFRVSTSVTVDAETPQAAAQRALELFSKSPPERFDVLDESGSTFHITRDHPQRSVDTIEKEVVQYPEFMENDAPPGAGG